jgi:hypothetical protein
MARIADVTGRTFGRLKSNELAPKLKKLDATFPDLILVSTL